MRFNGLRRIDAPRCEMAAARPAPDTRTIDWIVPIVVAVLLLVVSLLTLPTGAPTF